MARGTTIGYLPQDGVVHAGRTLFDEAASAFGNVLALQDEERVLSGELETLDPLSEEYQAAAGRLLELRDHLHAAGGHLVERDVEKVLVGLGFRHDDMQRLCEEFSGGWQMRIALAKLLLSDPSVLLLDEPTNYLDIEARVFLEGWLTKYPGALMLVSHDRWFLDRVITRITEVFDEKLTDYRCDYSRYLVEREERVSQIEAKAEELRRERERISQFINRFKYKADKAQLVQSRIRQLEKLQEIRLPPVRKQIHFRFAQPPRSGDRVLEVEGLSAGYGDSPDVISDASFDLFRGEKVPLVGINGAGKTTLIRLLAGLKEPRAGKIKVGAKVEADYFAQDTFTQLDPNATVYETVERVCPFDLVPSLRSLLGAFLFSGDDIEKKVSVLSGGERNRLVLARMLLKPSNLLLLDEPTNHLDLESKEVLLDALKRFSGTVLYVSHDRYFLDNLSTKVLAIDHGGLYVYDGTYPDFLHHLSLRDGRPSEADSPVMVAADVPEPAEKDGRARNWEEDRRKKRERERLERLAARLLSEIAAHEKDLRNLDLQMAEPRYASNFGELSKMLDRREELDREIERLTTEWEEAARLLEGVGGKG
ncbi:MAG: ABC-F family ATP-binding cassette domain-containing protein [Deltaproteobacteria bacterium]|nr:ABC-F family ATP-binding cassette domain-containing protein [Deltaproteobacteria bacterium]